LNEPPSGRRAVFLAYKLAVWLQVINYLKPGSYPSIKQMSFRMKYYHIDSCYAPANKKLLEVGQTINTNSRSFNPYYEQICDIHHVIPIGDKSIRLKEFLRSPNAKKFSSRDLANSFHSIISTYIRLLREMEFENIRREQFADRPSRMRCIWLTDDLDRAAYWCDRLNKSGGPRVVQVEVDGNLHEADGRHLSDESSSLSELRAAAQNYWRGVPHSNPEKEFLLEGSITVVEVC
jgi:hypothetical protein